MITRKLNLSCKNGHRHWAPKPSKWYGSSCDAPIPTGKGKCLQPLKRYYAK